MQFLMNYYAELGCIKINGVLFENWTGTGLYSLYFSNTIPEGFSIVKRVVFDLRKGKKLQVSFADDGDSEVKDFYEKDLSGLLTLTTNNEGDFCLVGI